MRTYVKVSLGIATAGGLLMAGASSRAITSGENANQYGKIVERNLFGLRTTPPPTEETRATPPPKIFLTGITTILGNKRALLKVMLPNRPGEPAKEESYILTEGQREGNVEVVEIDERLGLVKVNNFGTDMTLSFDKDGVKPQNLPATVAAPAQGPVVPRYILPRLQRFPSRNLEATPQGSEPIPGPTGGPSVPPIQAAPAPPATAAPAPDALPLIPSGQLTPSERLLLWQLEQEQNATLQNPPPPTPMPRPGQGPSVFHRMPLPQ